MYSSSQVRKIWSEFRLSKQHIEAKPVSLVASSENKSVLFNVAGMQQFVPYLVGKPHPLGQRLYNIQRCIRTNDIEGIGDERHLSMFEMMGNWSLGDYFKVEALTWTVEFLVDVLWIPKHRLGATIFAWDEATNIPRDVESYNILRSLGIEHISELWFDEYGDSDNFWTPGAIGPCGPCCEFYYDRWVDGQIYIDPITDNDMASDWDIWVNDRYTEIWNNVFMAYYQDWSGNGFTPLSQTNVDTGMWFERLMMVLQNTQTLFETDLFMPIIQQIEQLTHTQYISHFKAYRVILDHLRASIFLIADGVTPSNEWRWYILRRLIRRAYYYIWQLVQDHQLNITKQILWYIQAHYKLDYPHIVMDPVSIISECIKFQRTLDQGRVMLADIIAKTQDMIDGDTVFKLYDTYGFPSELTIEIAWHNHKLVDQAWFESALFNAQERSRANANFKNTIDRSKYLWGISETKFIWYDHLTSSEFSVLSDFDVNGRRVIVLDQTVFYPEMGWQRGDSGFMMLATGEQVTVTDTIKFAGVILHLVE